MSHLYIGFLEELCKEVLSLTPSSQSATPTGKDNSHADDGIVR